MIRFLSGPVIPISGPSSHNNPFVITIGTGDMHPRAVEAQERFEQATVRLILLLVGGPLAVLTYLYINPYLSPLAFFAGGVVSLIRPVSQWLELHGTALDIAVATQRYGVNRDEYEMGKAERRSYSYSQFSGLSPEQVKQLLFALRPWADRNAKKWG